MSESNYNCQEVDRFPENATPEQKAEFAKALVKALDDAEVKPGESFYVVSEDNMQRIDNDARAADERVDELESEVQDSKSLEEAIEDWDRGILTNAELLDKARNGC